MSNDSVSQQQLISLEKKLEKAIVSRAALEKDLSSQSSVLLSFIDKLSLVCKGMDLELDNRLANFRQAHKKSQSFIALSNQINLISGLLTQQAKKNDLSVKMMHEQLISSSKSLQKSKGMPADTRRNLRTFIETISDKKETIAQYVPALKELVNLYEQVITAKNNTNLPTNDNNTKVIAPEFIEKLKVSINNAINSLSLSDRNQKSLLLAQKEVAIAATTDDVINNLTHVFSIISLDLRQERDTAKNFLSALSKTLSNVQKAVQATIETSDSVKTQNIKLNDQLQEQLSQVSVEIAEANSLEIVKSDINEKLSNIVNLLEEKQAFEESSNQLISGKLIEMTERVKQLEEESLKFQSRLQEQLVKSMQDALTKLNNRAAFDEYFTKAIVKYHHQPYELSLVVFDIDDFKRINDTYGHTAGDKTLQVIANTLSKNVTKKTFIGRYGGEEFVMIFSDKNKAQLLESLDILRKKIALLPFSFKNNKVSITTSIGCTHIKAGDNIHQAFERADQALYEAKNKGKNRVIYQE